MQTETLYIGNATRQHRQFQYRAKLGASVRVQEIPPGTQVKISGDLTPAEVDYIVKQHAKYGLVEAGSVDQARSFTGTCYSIGKPIQGVKLVMLWEHNLDELVKQGSEIRRQSAVAQNDLLQTTLRENGRSESIAATVVTVQEEHHDPNNNVAQFSEGFRVIRGGAETPSPARRGGRRKAA